MNEEQLRLECLQLAISLNTPPERVVEFADQFLAFVRRS